jgi:hypothetical protein
VFHLLLLLKSEEMKIVQPEKSQSTIRHQIEDLKRIVNSLSNNSVRPCEYCTEICATCGSLKCTCNCSVDCPNNAENLSSDATLYPIETEIMPLVYCFNEMNICQTCWSCEGHNDMNGKLQKLPQIWFYTDSFMLLRVIDDSLSLLSAKSLLIVPWQVSTTYTAKSCEQSAFALKPDLSLVDVVDLKTLHKDIIAIADNLPEMIKKASVDYINNLQKTLLTFS